MAKPNMRFLISAILLVSLSSVVTAQFGFFDHMFGGQGRQQQQQKQQPPHAGSQWLAHADSVSCSSYLCPDTLVCVDRPTECPCPSQEDIKCVIPDAEDADAGTVVCVRGSSGCSAVEHLMRMQSK